MDCQRRRRAARQIRASVLRHGATDIARQAGLLHFLPDVRITHQHYLAGLAARDETYQHSARTATAGEAEFDRRRSDRRQLARRASRDAGMPTNLTRLALPSAVERLLLIAACRRDETAGRAWTEWLAARGPALATPASERLFPLVWWNLQRLGVSGPDVDTLKPFYRTSWGSAHILAGAAARATKSLRDAGIPAIVVGGVAIGSRYYDAAPLRPTGQVSLMVLPQFADRARRLVEALAPPAACRMVTCPFDGRASGLPRDSPWSRTEDAAIGGEQVRALSAADELLRVCVKGVRRRSASAPHWVADLFAIVERASDRLDWNAFVEEARAARASAQARIALHYARDTFEVPALQLACERFAGAAKGSAT